MATDKGKFDFHGAFRSKEKAVEREKAGAGRFIIERTVNGRLYYVVLSERK